MENEDKDGMNEGKDKNKKERKTKNITYKRTRSGMTSGGWKEYTCEGGGGGRVWEL